MDNTLGIYIHIPFCVKKCPYCDFNSFATDNIPEQAYIAALLKEWAAHLKQHPNFADRKLDTIYFGGGTPSLISPSGIEKLIKALRQSFSIASAPEITVEVNPGTVKRDRLAALKDAGVNRLSLGIQSFNGKTVKSLGRSHTATDAQNCCEYARRAGFANIGLDLIFGGPGQTLEEWAEDLKTAVLYKPQHISAYNLTIEQGTSFFKQQQNGGLALPSEEEQALMYETAIETLQRAGYDHYEISNFARAGFQSRHNLRYWFSMDYIGLGAGAHSYASSPDWGIRWWNESAPAAYMQHIQNRGLAIAGKEKLAKEEAWEEGVFLGLRRTTGIEMDWFAVKFKVSLKDLYAHQIAKLRREGMLDEDVHSLRLTRKGILLSNTVFAEFI